jgi:hypothetical protein
LPYVYTCRLQNIIVYLRAVGVGASVGHGKKARAIVAESEVLIVELATVDRFAYEKEGKN